MKRFSIFLLASLLAACGGGGGTTSAPPTVPPTPTPPPIANTSLTYYLPLGSGNSWTFASGGKLADLGSLTLTCSCPANGISIERIGLYPPSSQTLSSSFFFTKNTPTGGTQLTNVIGVENDTGTNNITLASSAAFPDGVPVMDDSPAANESWNDGAGDSSTITSVGGTMSLPSGSKIVDIADDQITGNFNPISWDFAKGVGFTSIGVGNQSTTLTSFYVSTVSSFSRVSQSISFAHGSPGHMDPTRLLTELFK